MRLVELRVAMGRAVRERRESRGLTQSQVAAMIGSTQPGLARIEAAARNVSLDQMARALYAVGGDFAITPAEAADGIRQAGRPSRPGTSSPKRRTPKARAE